MNWNIRDNDVVTTLNNILEDGVGRIHSTAEDFEARVRDDVREIAGRTREVLKRGRGRAAEAGEALTVSAREHPAITALAAAGLLLVIGGVIFAATRPRSRW